MAQLIEADGRRKISLLSMLSNKYDEKRKSLPPSVLKEPKDKYHLMHIVMFLLGFMNIMPAIFFAIGNDYWMYKFRNITLESEASNGEDRTDLQKYFQSSMIIVQTVPNVILSTLTMTYTKYISERVVGSLIGLTVSFVLFVVFAKINTDEWQTEFFVLSMILLLLESVFASILGSASILLAAKLPRDYLFYFIIGQNGIMIITLLQILLLGVTNSRSTTGMLYFITGTLVILMTLILTLLMIRSEPFKYYVTETNDKSDAATFSNMMKLMKTIWPCQLVCSLFIFSLSTVNPSLMTLVVPQHGLNYNKWTSKYFTPVTVFLAYDVFGSIGKVVTRKIVITKSNQWWHISIGLIVPFIVIPFYIFCNVQPRTLPVVFDQDWQYIVITILYDFYTGYAMNITFMSLKTLSDDQEDAAFSLINVTFSVVSVVFCANGLIAVKLTNI